LRSATDRSLVSRSVIVAVVAAAAIAGCGDPPAPDKATSEAQVRQRMLEYNLMQITPGSGPRLCSYMVPDAREAWKEDDSKAATVMRDLLPPSVVDCESHWDYFIGLFMRDPKVVELIRSAQITHVDLAGETATATLSFGGTFEWRWQDGRWLMNRNL
jgi:hypothetical protein